MRADLVIRRGPGEVNTQGDNSDALDSGSHSGNPHAGLRDLLHQLVAVPYLCRNSQTGSEGRIIDGRITVCRLPRRGAGRFSFEGVRLQPALDGRPGSEVAEFLEVLADHHHGGDSLAKG